MMKVNYKEYLQDRLSGQDPEFSLGEFLVRKAISVGAKGKFRLLHLTSNIMYLYECETNDEGNMFRIKKHYMHKHTITSDNKYIEYVLSILPEEKDQSLYVAFGNTFSVNKSIIMESLKNKAASVIVLQKDIACNRSLKCIFPDIIFEQIHTQPPIGLIDCINGSKPIYVPLTVECLDSTFWGQFKWRDIIPNEECDCKIADVDCKSLTIKLEVDGFQNIFGKIEDCQKHRKYILLHETQNVTVTEIGEQENQSPRDRKMSNEAQKYEYFMPDTNVLINDPDILTFFSHQKGKKLRIPLMVYREINTFKDTSGHYLQKKAEKVYRIINKVTSLDSSMIEKVEKKDIYQLPRECQLKFGPDDCIIALAIKYKLRGDSICLITEDNGMRAIINALSEDKKPMVLSTNDLYENIISIRK